MTKIGIVTESDPTTMKIRAQIPDLDGMVTYWMPVLTPKAGKDKVYNLPDIGEEVLLAFLDNGVEQGFCLGSIYNFQDKPPVSSGDKFHITFKDGTVLEYDRHSHILTAFVAGTAVITADSITVHGDLTVNGNITATGAIIDAGGNTNHHSHS
jgi:phage baseplate assembly protein V